MQKFHFLTWQVREKHCISFLCFQATELKIYMKCFSNTFSLSWLHGVHAIIVSHHTSDHLWAAGADTAGASYAGVHHRGQKLPGQDLWWDFCLKKHEKHVNWIKWIHRDGQWCAICVCVYAGICGNFNKVLLDELMTPQGVVEGTPVSFANSWKAQSNCPDRTERMDDPCSYSSDSGERLFASKVSVVKSGRFFILYLCCCIHLQKGLEGHKLILG